MPHTHKFVHLHCHSQFSLLDGAGRIPGLVAEAKKLGMPALALTDHGNMYATVQFYLAAKEAGIKPIIGCELYVAPRTRHDKETKEDRSPHHLTFLAKDLNGYRNLIKLASIASIEGFYSRPRIDKEVLEKYKQGLVVLSGCPVGKIPSLLRQDKFEEAKQEALWLKRLFKEDFYLEMQELGLEDFKGLNAKIIELTKATGIKLVATNDVHYIKKEDAYAQDVLLCIQTGSFLDEAKRLKFDTQEFYLKSPQEMIELFKDTPEAISSTLEIADKCNVDLEIGTMHLPNFPVPKGETPDTYLEKLVWEGIKKRYGKAEEKVMLPPEVIDRIKYELYTIEKMGYAAYFLIVQDFINAARAKGIQVGPGRGSAAGSVVSYALKITNIDPLKYGLLFERFLNIERISMPDIDIDFCIERRSEVIEYVSNKYGQDHVAQIVTFGTMAARAAIRDVGRVQRVPLAFVDKIAKMIPFMPGITIAKALEMVKELKDLYDKDEIVKHLLETAKKLEGLSRHASVHAAGVVISEKPLTEYVPLQQIDKKVVVTQYPMGDLEKMGLLKMDFLGLRNLTMIANALRIIKRTRNMDIDIDNLAVDDTKTYQLLMSGETMGIFQLESRGMKALVKDLAPSSFEEIIALLALYRPGPLESGMVSDYVKRKHKQVPIKYMLPQLQPILRETYGVILYQEQVMQIASKVAGFSLGQADVLRRAMGKKKAKEMQQQKEIFVEGAVKRGVTHHKATELFNLCAKFAGYGFNKSHSAAYGVISYQTAYLKANYPIEFMAALLTSVMGNSDKVTAYANECRRLKIKILGPDINESYRGFTVTKEGIRFGLSAIKNVGVAAIDSIINAKKEGGNFESLANFCKRIDTRACNKKVIESLIKVGGFDSFNLGRAYLLNVLPKTLSRVNSEEKEKANGQSSLFQMAASNKPAADGNNGNVEVEEFPPEQVLKMEKDLLGLYISSHPLEYVKDSLEGQVKNNIADISDMREGEPIKIGGLLSESRRITTKKGDAMLVGKLEDLSGTIGLVVFPRTFKKCEALLTTDEVIIIKGKVNRDMRSDELNVVAEEVLPMEQLEKVRSLYVEVIDINAAAVLAEMKRVLNLFKGDDPVFIKMEGNKIALGKNFHVNITPELVEQLENLLGSGSVRVEFRAVKKEKEEVKA